MNFSSILDISSFFIGMIINLILVSLMCYYFKRKYEILECAQTEPAKILYELLRRDSNSRTSTFLDTLETKTCPIDYTQDPLLKQHVIDCDSESDSESDDDSDDESIDEITLPANPPVSPKLSRPATPEPELKTNLELDVDTIDLSKPMEWVPIVETKVSDAKLSDTNEMDTKEIVIELDTETNYSKMSIKQLKDILTSKGVKHRNNMKKDELVDLVKETGLEVSI